LVAGVDLRTRLAIQGFRQNASRGRLTDASGAGKEKRMGHSFLSDGILEGLGDGTLSDNILKNLRPPFSGQNKIGHDSLFEGRG
jgi:hypothetical protein